MMKRPINSSWLVLLAIFLCQWAYSQEYNLNTGLDMYWPAPNQSKPGYLQPATDVTFGTTITRITGDVGTPIQNIPGQNWRNTARHGYSTRQPWNADESMIYLGKHRNLGGSSGPDLFLDGETYEVIKEADLPSGNEHRWHRTDPDLFWIIRDDEIITWNVHTDEITQLMSYDGYSDVDMGGTGNFTDDGTKVAVSATRDSDNTLVMFMLDIVNQTKGPDIDISDINTLGHVSISSLGNYIIIIGTYPSGGDRTKVYTTEGTQVGFWDEYGMPSHYDLATDLNGEEVAVGVSKSNPHKGKLIKRRLSDGVVTELTVGGWPPHTSARALNRPGWVFASSAESTNYGPYLREVIAVKLDGSRVERIAHSRNNMDEYLNETHACPSPSGSRVMFASDWGANSVPIQAYVADFRHLEINGTPQVNAGNDVTICEGDTVTLTASGAQNYDWSTGGSTPSISVNPSSTTTYTVTGTHSDGSTSTDEVIVIVHELPDADAGEDRTICEGDTITLTANGGTSYLWNTGATTQSITVSPDQTTNYTVTAFSNNCEANDDVLVVVNPLPNVDAGTDVSILEGETVTLTATGGESYLWSTGATTSSIQVTPNQTTIYTVTAFLNECEASDEVEVVVNAPVSADAGEDQTICFGESITLTATGGDTYLWNTGATTSSITVTPDVTTNYSVTVSTDFDTDTDEVLVIVNALPTVDAGVDVVIDSGETIVLTASGGDSYLWNTGETTSSITVSPTETTIYAVVAYLNDCEAMDEVLVTVNGSVLADAGSDQTICEGDLVTLTASGGDSYLWSTGETTASITVNPSSDTTYSVEVTVGNISDSDDVTVFVNALPNVNLGADQAICQGDSVVLIAPQADSYLWSTGATTQSITVSPEVTSTYSVTVIQNNCEATDMVVINVNPLPIANAGSDVSIVVGESATLTATGGDSYLWSTGETTQTIIVNPESTTTYSVIAYLNDCEALDEVVVTVDAGVNANAGEDVAICQGQSVTLTATGGSSYLWSTGETTQSIIVSPEATSNYTVLVSNAFSQDTDEVTVFVTANPEVEVSGDVMILTGDYVTLSATGANNYEWSNGSTQPNIAVNPSETTTYFVTGYVNDCSDTKDVTVSVLEYVQADAGDDVWICPGEAITLTANGGESYVWSTGETTQSITVDPEEDTTYTVLVSNALDSQADEVKVYMDMNTCESILPPEDQTSFEYVLYFDTYNPNLLHIKFGGLQGNAQIMIHDLVGNLVYQEQFDDHESAPFQKQLSTVNYSTGVYLVTFKDNVHRITKRLLFR